MVVSAALAVFFLTRSTGDSQPSTVPPHLVERAEIAELEESIGHAIYWEGNLPNAEVELSMKEDGSVFVRYLPPEARVGNEKLAVRNVGTYVVPEPLKALQLAAKKEGSQLKHLSHGIVVLAPPKNPNYVYFTTPGSELEVEVYDPIPGKALALVREGTIKPAG